MNEDNGQTGAACGCDCEFCSGGNHAACTSGKCTMKDQPAGAPPQDGNAAPQA